MILTRLEKEFLLIETNEIGIFAFLARYGLANNQSPRYMSFVYPQINYAEAKDFEDEFWQDIQDWQKELYQRGEPIYEIAKRMSKPMLLDNFLSWEAKKFYEEYLLYEKEKKDVY